MQIHDRDLDLDLDDDDEPTSPGRALPRARVLIVEDNTRFRTVLTKRLENDGYEVYQASTGDEAVAMLHFVGKHGWPTDDFELMILDHHLPGRSGIEILQRLRTEDDTIPALMVTAFPDSELIAEAKRCGARVLAKPFSLDRLSDAMIDAIMTQRRARCRGSAG